MAKLVLCAEGCSSRECDGCRDAMRPHVARRYETAFAAPKGRRITRRTQPPGPLERGCTPVYADGTPAFLSIPNPDARRLLIISNMSCNCTARIGCRRQKKKRRRTTSKAAAAAGLLHGGIRITNAW
jgi:hypothetical protein